MRHSEIHSECGDAAALSFRAKGIREARPFKINYDPQI